MSEQGDQSMSDPIEKAGIRIENFLRQCFCGVGKSNPLTDSQRKYVQTVIRKAVEGANAEPNAKLYSWRIGKEIEEVCREMEQAVCGIRLKAGGLEKLRLATVREVEKTHSAILRLLHPHQRVDAGESIYETAKRLLPDPSEAVEQGDNAQQPEEEGSGK